MQVQSLGWEDSLEEDMATHCSILAWRILWTEEPGGIAESLAWLKRLSTHTCQCLGLQAFIAEGPDSMPC